MNREHWKAMLPFVQAFANGEDVRFNGERLENISFARNVEDYEIVGKPEYRVFNTAAELLEALSSQKHQYLYHLASDTWGCPTCVTQTYVYVNNVATTYGALLRNYQFADMTPCGKRLDA